MFEELNHSFMDLDNSFLLPSDAEPNEDRYLEKCSDDEFESHMTHNILSGNSTQSYSESDKKTQSYLCENTNESNHQRMFQNGTYSNKKYKPIIDNGMT